MCVLKPFCKPQVVSGKDEEITHCVDLLRRLEEQRTAELLCAAEREVQLLAELRSGFSHVQVAPACSEFFLAHSKTDE